MLGGVGARVSYRLAFATAGRLRAAGLVVAALGLAGAGWAQAAPEDPPAAASKAPQTSSPLATADIPPELAQRFREWLETAAPFITDAERRAFLELARDYQRDAFIERFWRERDPFPQTARNELRERFAERIEFVRSRFGTFEDDRARILLVHGHPEARIEVRCTTTIVPAEVWAYRGSDLVDFNFLLVFLKFRWDGPAVVYRPAASGRYEGAIDRARECLSGDSLIDAIGLIERQGTDYDRILRRVLARPRPASEEWLATFAAFSTEVPEGAPRMPAEVEVAFPGRHDARTVVQAMLTVPREEVEVGEFAGYLSADFLLTGEVLAGETLFESFRYKFDVPAGDLPTDRLPLAFQRYLRPGDYTLILRLEDLNSHRFFRLERPLAVPAVEELFVAKTVTDSETQRLFAEATGALARGDTAVTIVPPAGDLLTGRQRIDTLVTGSEIAKVAFFLDDRYAMTKTRPPYNVELDFGPFPRLHTLRVEAQDESGRLVATDERLLNAGGNRFAVRLVEPRRGQRYEASLSARAEVEVPEGRSLERVEFFLNEQRVATLFQAPFVQPIVLPGGDEVTFVRAVAYLPDGSTTEDLVFVNAPENLEEVDVQFVELYTTATDERGRPVDGLVQADFAVHEDGAPQTVARFDRVRDLPIHAGILLDNSGSMRGSLDAVRRAALTFLQQAITPKDRAAVITFNRFPHLAVKLTNNLQMLGGGMAGLTAEGETALYDSLIFSLYYFAGIRGQRALLVLSDGQDEVSRFGFDETLEYARRAGVTIYTIGLGLSSGDARTKLTRLADETGGRSFFLSDLAGLDEIYRTIQEELRSQYLLAYQSNNTTGGDDFRNVELTVKKPGVKVKTISGYYP